MTLNIEKEAATLRRMKVGQLQSKFSQVFGEPTKARNKQWLVKRILWRLQAILEGDISDRARQRAKDLANDADLRTSAPKKPSSEPNLDRSCTSVLEVSNDSRLPLPGALLVREHKGQTLQVRVLPKGFEFEGEIFKSLSAVAKKITGQHCNGFYFFKLSNSGGSK
jgi:hypothetical protein